MLSGRGGFSNYATPGTMIAADYSADTLDLQVRLGNNFRNLPYHEIKRLTVFRDVVHLRKKNGDSIAIPRELAPEPALALIRKAGVRM